MSEPIRSTALVAIAAAGFLAGCTSTSSPRVVASPVRQGMTKAELTSAFGRPLRVERAASGAEDWYYNFGSQQRESHPVSESTASETGRSYSVGHASSTTTTMTAAPIHLSPSGRVVGAIPSGSVIAQ